MAQNDFIFSPENTRTDTMHRRFPALLQLGILATILVCIFTVILLPFFLKKPTTSPITAYSGMANTATTTVVSPIESISPAPIRATAAYVYDVATGRALYAKNADEALPLASITKLMTTLIAEELVSPNTTITIPKAAVSQAGSSGLAWGEVFTGTALRDYAMLASSNDAAYSIAYAVGKNIDDHANDPVNTFVTAMNVRAKELQLPTLQFYNATGLDISPTAAGAYGSARDINFLMAYILEHHPEILEATRESSDRIYNTAGQYHDADNTNPVINRIPNLIGSKTGYTDLAQGNLTIAFDMGYNRPIIITVLGSTYAERFSDVVTLANAVSKAFSTVDAVNE